MSLIGRQYEIADFDLLHALLAIRGRQPSIRWEARSPSFQISTSTSTWDWRMILNLRIQCLFNLLKINMDGDQLFILDFMMKI